MSFVDDGKEFSRKNRPALLMGILLTLALSLCVLVIFLELVQVVVKWWRNPNKLGWSQQRTIDFSNEELFSFDQFNQLLISSVGQNGEDEEVVALNLDPQLLVNATESAKNRWWIELEVDQIWNRLTGVGGWKSLAQAQPEMWRYLLIYRYDQEKVVGYDLRLLEEREVLDLEKAKTVIDQSEANTTLSLPIDQLEILGVVEDQLYVFAHNALDEGIILYTDYSDTFEEWRVWPQVKGKLAKAAGHSFLLQGFQEGCSAVYTFDKLVNHDKKLERMAITYNGCAEGERFLGVDAQGRILLAVVKKEGAYGLNLDIAGNYTDLIAVPISEPGARTRVLLTGEMPSGIHQAAFFPGNNTGELSSFAHEESIVVVNETMEEGIPESESNDNDQANINSTSENAVSPTNEEARWRASDQIVLVSAGGVWTVQTATGELKQVSDLMNMFGRPVIRSWHDETLCLEMVDKPQLSLQERMISIDLDTGVPIAGMEVCLRQGEEDRPYVSRTISQQEKEHEIARNAGLPSDFRLVYGEKLENE